jgi:hypothetical protein
MPKTADQHPVSVAVFEEVASIFGTMPDVALGRKFGRWCLKRDGVAFIVLDRHEIAFRVGLSADRLVAEYDFTRFWSPYGYRRAKQSWVVCPPINSELIAEAGAIAYAVVGV